MGLWTCRRCTTQFAVGLPYCPHCTSTDIERDEDGVPKNTVHGGPSNADEPAEAEAPAPAEAAQTPEPTHAELRTQLRGRGLRTSGSRDELAARLAADDQAKAEEDGEA